ncbi:MAG TPA: cohesin domain-containing protein [Ignavibacteriales bacterium]|nr:cohesin domain-containing protein [Ignavibacteriales bacterium]HOL80798.1 cohesin domain-containing protein [Ignavibacteriales bacterium]HOM66187.1 cohesin domain-containing protein [Ignavibacteriales bacterium]HPP33234.1 cohesin domain-containing protein [Ignavibacteriales bacterium]HRR17910.1 cohesin domain-containing protein [Ignavibacteriales bacterium]
MKTKYLKITYLILSIAWLFAGCDSSTTSGAAPIFLQITSGPKKDEIVNTDRVTFTWAGNDKGFQFKYILYYIKKDKTLELVDSSSWGGLTRTTFAYLDDGNYQFEVYGQFRGIFSKVTRNFTVNAVKGPLLKFFKLRTITQLLDTFKVSLWIEDVNNLLTADINIQFDKSYLSVDSIVVTNFEDFNTADRIGFILPDWSTIKDKTNSSGLLSFTYGIQNNASSTSEGVSGSGGLVTLYLVSKRTGTAVLKILNNSKLIDKFGKVITLKSPKDATIVIQ